MLDTLDALELPAGLGWELRKAIQADGRRPADGRRGRRPWRGGDAEGGPGRVDDWPLERDSFEALADGLERTYRRGRRGSERRRPSPSAEALHEWRKRVKDLWYHHTLLRELWPPVMQRVGDEAHELGDRLGDDHDLVVLAAWVRGHLEPDPEFSEAVIRRRGELQDDAFTLGARLYADKPSAYVRRLRAALDRRRGKG